MRRRRTANLALGITVFMGESCGDPIALAAAAGTDAYVVADVARRDDAALASLPNLIGWHHPDEPDGYGIESSTLRRPEPGSGRLTFLTLTSHFASDQRAITTARSHAWWKSYVAHADVVGFDLYPLAHRCADKRLNLASVYTEQRDLVALAAGRPTYQWIETTAIDGRCGPAPVTPAALRAEAFLAIAGGARGIGYFTHSWTSGRWDRFAVAPDLRQAVAKLNRELRALAAVLGGPDVSGLARTTAPVRVGVRRAGRHYLVIAVNPQQTPVRAQLRLRGVHVRSVVAWNEGRTIPAAHTGFTDWFEPLEVHVYDVAP